MKWRLLNTGNKYAYMNMAIDEAIMTLNSEGKVPPTVRLYGWTPAAVSIGYFQNLEDEIDLEVCKEHGIDYVRRITGGGAVFHDSEITYSFVIAESELPKDIMQSYDQICGAIIKGLSHFGIEPKFVPLNDIVVNGKKISGNAQTRRLKTILQHGTILLKVDVEKMFSLLKVPDEKIRDKMISTVKERVTSLSKELDRDVSFDETAEFLKKGFEEQFGIELVAGELTPEETELAEKIKKEKFETKEWNHKR